MDDTTQTLLAALTRLLAAYKADVETCPGMPVRMSFETNGQAVIEAEAAIALVGARRTLTEYAAHATHSPEMQSVLDRLAGPMELYGSDPLADLTFIPVKK